MGVKALKSTLAALIVAEIGLGAACPTAAAQGAPPAATAASAAPASPPVTLVVDLQPGSKMNAEQLRAAVGRELGSAVVWDRNAAGGTIVVRQDGGHVVVSYDGPDGRHDGRAIPLPDDPEHAERDIALLAGNVARDQVSPLLPKSAPAPGEAPRPLPAVSPCEAEGPRLPVGADVAPMLGVSTADRGRSIRNLSLGLAGALSGGVQGLALSGGVDIAGGALCGAQVAGGVTVARDAQGAQIAGGIAIASAMSGLQLAGGLDVAGSVTGAQIAGGVTVAAGDLRGMQLAPINVTTGHASFQLGVVNVAKDADFQLGIINVNGSGRLLVDVWGQPEMGLLLAGLKHGGAHYHWIYFVGSRPADTARPWFGLGFGVHATPSDRVFVDADVLSANQFVFNDNSAVWLAQARVVGGLRVVPGLSVFAGPTFNFLGQGKSARPGAPSYAHAVTQTSKTDFSDWLGATVGVEAL
jgi:hypothetical protein